MRIMSKKPGTQILFIAPMISTEERTGRLEGQARYVADKHIDIIIFGIRC